MVESLRRGLLGLSLLALTTGVAGHVHAAQAPSAQSPAVAVRTPKGPLKDALLELGRQTGVQIIFASRAVEGRQAPALDGAFSVEAALARLLAGSDLEAQRAGPSLLVIRPRAGLTPTSAIASPASDLLASPTPEPLTAAPPVQASDSATMLSEVVVGSRIRGVKDTASPVVVLGREEIDRAGYASVAEALTSLPQASGGSASEDSLATGADSNFNNTMRGTGVDLRGLGADATLVLFNGKRLAGAGLYGDFSDISSIPYAAIGRVEVLLDGASALYGSDAVGGVVDMRLRTDLDGGETRLSTGAATQGGYARYLASQAFGKTWSGGHILAAYEYTRNDALHGLDRDYTGNADLRPWGGTDRRSAVAAQPANILRLNSAGAYVSTYAVPAGQNGVGLKPSDFILGTVNYQNQKAAYDVIPRSSRHSAVVSVAQSAGPVELSGDFRFAHREIFARNVAPTTALILNAANPYYVSPTGQASERIAYSFLNERGGVKNWGTSESLGAALGAKTRLGDWTADLSGTYAQELGISRTRGQINATNLSEAAGLTADNPLTSFSAARDGYFNPYIGAGYSNPAAVLDFILSGWDLTKTRSEFKSANLDFEGPLLRLPGGTLRLAVGGQVRREEVRTGGARLLSGSAPFEKATTRYSRDVKAVYAELNAPLVGPDNALPLVERLELSLAGRIEDYDDTGSTRNPKVGLIWAPSKTLTFKASYGTSFRAPSLYELHLPYTITPIPVTYQGGLLPALVYQGGNPDLKPETATSWTAGLSYSPAAAPELTVGLNVYRTLFKNRVGQPVVINQALTSDEYAAFRTRVSPATNPADRAKVLAVIADPNASGTNAYDVDTYGAIIDAREVNTGSLEVEGLDATAGYRTSLRGDPLVLNASLSWLTHYKRKLTPTSAHTELAGQAGYPADLRGRVSATWIHGPVSVTTGLNHVGDSYADTGRRVHPWTTFDLQGRWQGKILAVDGLAVTLNVQNLFDQDPPFYDNPLAVGYDPVNADPLGRVISLTLTKAW
ncbi:TonB-dependent receptor [Caulobacter sp. FWC2]|uniref:TonB-dependent receptor n=1 Tax=Caulobacter sp. FWC2 TaxID=69664 RepID=UPI000C14EF18|nr:TonB-dependent receptor [Caulobacter sp. FWC2]PIB92753.1 TonB-dependent receptor [Caulobacter sp. FWC2]